MSEQPPRGLRGRASHLDYQVILIAGHADLMTQLAELRWREWNDQAGKEALSSWLADVRRDSERDSLPVGFVALDEQSRVIGGLSLRQVEYEELSDRGPWLEGVIVSAESRGQGVGRELLNAVEAWSAGHGISRLWVCNEGPAVGFYERCGWTRVEDSILRSGLAVTILTRHFNANVVDSASSAP